ncbi:hypothetical protein QEZ54_29385 [Catellatospora sp. KI3]|uniref:hypothetical protein n=1 Tax=Catellatospora sp. KI3 TaxID=3041620 RepID=UPI002482EEC0|nr:hypothetical protein [Catellatospora sp. KI3]MDI1465090.1 hypothetical protein [Catellatospora sp. KI3]
MAAVVALIVIIGKLVGGSPAPLANDPPPATQAPVDSDAGDDGVVRIDPTPSALKPSSGPQVVSLATSFAKNWIQHDRSADDWLEALRPMCTETLTAELDGVDPVSVPASRITGAAHVEALADSYVEVAIPIDAGTLRLRLVAPGGKWLVDGIDWERT